MNKERSNAAGHDGLDLGDGYFLYILFLYIKYVSRMLARYSLTLEQGKQQDEEGDLEEEIVWI
jgi:hypothetical protein